VKFYDIPNADILWVSHPLVTFAGRKNKTKQFEQKEKFHFYNIDTS